MTKVKRFPECVAVLVDIVASREGDRSASHAAILDAIEAVNSRTKPLGSLRVTVGDEMQGIYPTLGEALHATFELRDLLFGAVDLRFGLGGGDVEVVDFERGIQDGSAWWRAREATDHVRHLADLPGHASARTCIRDSRDVAVPAADELVRLVDAHLASLRDGSRRSLIGLLAGKDNAEVASAEGITPSANSQRVNSGALRPLADAIWALRALP